jgi:hypothetical protein
MKCVSRVVSVYISLTLQSYLDLGRFFSFLILYALGMAPWTGDQPVARPLHTHRINAYRNTHALSGIRTHDLSIRASKDSSWFRLRSHCDRFCVCIGSYVLKKQRADEVVLPLVPRLGQYGQWTSETVQLALK